MSAGPSGICPEEREITGREADLISPDNHLHGTAKGRGKDAGL